MVPPRLLLGAGVVVSLLVPAAPTSQDGAAAKPRGPDGKALYVEHCATCHGKDGGGDGPLAKDLRFKPRAFKEGKFAFGNTIDAMVKTVNSGVPGEDAARMPAFKQVLSVEEIAAVVDYVRTLMPLQPEMTPADMKMEPKERPLVARGILAPLRDGEKPLARGLLLGLPSGFSFEYATEDLRLVAVRRGGFVTRSDWEGRGGRPLTPLGEPLWIAPALERWAPFVIVDSSRLNDGGPRVVDRWPAHAKLRQTAVRGAGVELRYDLVGEDGTVRVRAIERPVDATVAAGAGVAQEFELVAAADPVKLLVSIALGGQPEPAAPSDSKATALVRGWHVVKSPDGGVACVRFDAPDQATVTEHRGPDFGTVDLQLDVGATPVKVRRTTLFLKDASQLDSMIREFKQ
jgi:mono/diheme cytochrome c family protein